MPNQTHVKKLFSLHILILLMNVAFAQSLTPTAALLFKNIKSKLSVTEKNFIAEKSDLTLSPDKKKFILKEDPGSLYSVDVYPLDLNRDGNEEIFIAKLSSFFGMSGEEFRIYSKDAGGAYHEIIGLVGNPLILSTTTEGYSDLLIGGPGFQFPVWQWNGKSYAFAKSISDADLQKLNRIEIEEASKAYTSGTTIKPEVEKQAAVKEPAEDKITPLKSSETMLTTMAASLFKNTKSILTTTQKNMIAKKSGLSTTDTVITNGLGKTKINTTLLPVDLNNDGAEEIFIAVKTTSLTISNTTYKLFVKNNSDEYEYIPLNIKGPLKIITDSNKVYPDLLAGPAGLDRDLLKWNGNAYVFNMKVNGLAALLYKVISIESESEKYAATISFK